MYFNKTIITAVFCTLSYAGDVPAQDIADEAAREHMRGSNREQVGPTMWRNRPHDTAYDEWIVANRSRMPIFEGLVIVLLKYICFPLRTVQPMPVTAG